MSRLPIIFLPFAVLRNEVCVSLSQEVQNNFYTYSLAKTV